MSVDQTDIIDFIDIDKETDRVIISISDHLVWDDDNDHLFLLQGKINTYLKFIESGEIYESYPLSEGKKITIKMHAQFEPGSEGLIFLACVKEIVEGAGFDFIFEQHED